MAPACDLLVCDLVGTTVEDGPALTDAITATLARHGVTLDAEGLATLRGARKRDALARALGRPDDANLADQLEREFRADLADRCASQPPRNVPGAADAIERLRTAGLRVAVTTGLDRTSAESLLAGAGWIPGRDLDALVCGDDVPQGRPAPYLIFRAMERTGAVDVHRVAAAGDTALDLQAGWNAGVRWNVGVLSGAHDRARLAAAPHTHLLRSIAELDAMLIGS